MKVNKIKKWSSRDTIVVGVILILALVITFVSVNIATTPIGEGNTKDAQKAVAEYLKKETEDVQVLKMAWEGQVIFVLCKTGNSDEIYLVTLEQFAFFSGRYKVQGAFSTHAPRYMDRLRYQGQFKGLPSHLSMMVVYGDNTNMRAHSYTLSTGNVHNVGPDISQSMKDDYILDIYYYNRSMQIFQLRVFDEHGNEIIQSNRHLLL